MTTAGQHLRLGMVLLATIAASGALPRACSSQSNGQAQTAGPDASSQPCDELQHRGPEFEPLTNVCQYAVKAPHSLPDFVCTEVVKQYRSSERRLELISAELTMDKTGSHYAAVTVNGKSAVRYGMTGDTLFKTLVGSTGEFAMLFNIFASSSHAAFSLPVEAVLRHRRLKRYDFRVKRENNQAWTWYFPNATINPGYHGSIFADATTGEILRLVTQVDPDEIDPQTEVSQVTTTIDYDDVPISEAGTHHVPVRAENVSCFRGKGCTHQELTFSKFHKFGSKVHIMPTP